MTESIESNKSRLEDPEFMDKLVDAVALKVEEFLDNSKWSTWSADSEWQKNKPQRSDYDGTKIILERIRRKEKLDGLRVPADVSEIIRVTCHSDFGLSIDETYQVLYMYFSEYEQNLNNEYGKSSN